MGLLNIIRRMSLREKLSIREISRRTGLSRNTITKHLNAGTIEPQFTTPDRQSKLDPFADKLTGWLKAEAGKSRKQRRTLKQLHADLVVLGFSGSYNRVAAFARDWRFDLQRESQTTGRGTFVPLTFSLGEAFQFDCLEPPRVYRRAKLSENCPLWNRHKRRRPRSRIPPSSANVRCGWLWNTAMSISLRLRR